MQQLLAVGLGGFLGASLRHVVSVLVQRRLGASFPYSTLVVNVLGCLLVGAFLGLAMRRDLEETTRLFVVVGLLSSFTTFSTFGHDTLVLWAEAGPARAVWNVLGHVLLGLAAVVAGASLVR